MGGLTVANDLVVTRPPLPAFPLLLLGLAEKLGVPIGFMIVAPHDEDPNLGLAASGRGFRLLRMFPTARSSMLTATRVS